MDRNIQHKQDPSDIDRTTSSPDMENLDRMTSASDADHLRNIYMDLGDIVITEGNVAPVDELAPKIFDITKRMYTTTTASILYKSCRSEEDQAKCLSYFPNLKEYFALCETQRDILLKELMRENSKVQINEDQVNKIVAERVATLVPDENKFASYGALPNLEEATSKKILARAEASRIEGSTKDLGHKPQARNTFRLFAFKKVSPTPVSETDISNEDGTQATASIKGKDGEELMLIGGMVVDVKADNEFLESDPEHKLVVSGDPGFFMDPDYQGQGIATRMTQAMLTLLYHCAIPNALAHDASMLEADSSLTPQELDTIATHNNCKGKVAGVHDTIPDAVSLQVDESLRKEVEKLAQDIDLATLKKQYEEYNSMLQERAKTLQAQRQSNEMLIGQLKTKIGTLKEQQSFASNLAITPAHLKNAQSYPLESTVHPLNTPSQKVLKSFNTNVEKFGIRELQKSYRYLSTESYADIMSSPAMQKEMNLTMYDGDDLLVTYSGSACGIQTHCETLCNNVQNSNTFPPVQELPADELLTSATERTIYSNQATCASSMSTVSRTPSRVPSRRQSAPSRLTAKDQTPITTCKRRQSLPTLLVADNKSRRL